MGLKNNFDSKRRQDGERGAIAVEFVGQSPRSVPGKLEPPGRAIGNV